MNSRAVNPHRLMAAALLLTASLMASLVFYGPAVNLLVLAAVAALLLLALMCVGTAGIAGTLETNRWGVGLSLAMIGYLVVAYRLALSADNSFAPSWVLAAGPIAFICGSVVVGDFASRRSIMGGVLILVVLLAVVSCVRFVVYGERAHEPMVDPNQYATLLYLVWIPLVHWHLARSWRNEPAPPPAEHVRLLAISFVLLLSIIATHSRTSQVIVLGCFVLWALLGAVRRAPLRILVAHAGVALAASVVALVVGMFADVSSKGLDFGGGLSVRQELIRAALAMLAQHPFGIGVFGFPLLYPSFRSTLEQETAGLFVHNDYVQFLVEGGVPLLVLLLLFVGLTVRRALVLVRLPSTDARFADLGLAIALIAVCAHAMVNFVFYSLTLTLLIGLIAALLFAGVRGDVVDAVKPIRIPSGTIGIGIALGWVMWLYLVLDVAIVAVFQDQPSLGFGTSIRKD